jgi:Secretion system C-terminal sorting domain
MKIYFKILLILIGILSINNLAAQNPYWILPNNTNQGEEVDVPSGTPISNLPITNPENNNLPYTGVYGLQGGYDVSEALHTACAGTITNGAGDLAFFHVGNSFFDKRGRCFYSEVFDGFNSLSSGFAEMPIIPNPGNCMQYYVFGNNASDITDAGPISTPVYGIVDVSQNNSNPNFNPNAEANLALGFQPVTNITGLPAGTEPKNQAVYYAVDYNSTTDEYFVFIISYTSTLAVSSPFQRMTILKIDANGISHVNTIDLLDLFGVTQITNRGEFEVVRLSNSNYRFAIAGSNKLYFGEVDNINFNFVPNTAIAVNLGLSISPQFEDFVSGIEFTQDGRYAYINHNPTNIRPFVTNCYDVQNNAWVTLNWASQVVTDFRHSYIERQGNGNFYMINSSNLAEISNANDPPNSFYDGTYQLVSYISNEWYQGFNDLENVRYTLPDQIDNLDYFANQSNSPQCCVKFNEYDAFNFTADINLGANQMWTPNTNPINPGSNLIYIENELRIPAGVNVTIDNMTFLFHPDARVVIERSDNQNTNNGAKLTMQNGTVFTVENRCGDEFMWQGVDVQGWKLQSQIPINNSRQGFLQMLSGATIEHALIGAEGQDISNNTSGLDRGGIIRTNNAIFRNNRMDIRIFDYDNFNPFNSAYFDNQSTFVLTDFITNGLLNTPSLFTAIHAFILNADGIRFLGCRFENETPTLYTEGTVGSGILNVRSKLTVVPSCSSLFIPCTGTLTPNQFNNLRYGIYAVSSNGLEALKIDQNEFTDNLFGVYVGGVDFPEITRNNFQIATSINPDFELGRTYGIYLNGSSGFKIEENDLSEFDDPSSITGQTRGIIVNNSGDGEILAGSTIPHNEIYNNVFTDLLIGGQSQGINSPDHSDPFDPVPGGLQWLCNDFNTDISADLYVSSGRIDYNQGYFVNPILNPTTAPFKGARNFFSFTTGGEQISVVSGVQESVYVHYINPTTDPIDYSFPNFTKLGIPITISQNQSCPSKILGNIVAKEKIGLIFGKIDDLANEIDENKSLIDGGDSNALLNLIANGSNGSVKNALLGLSPYLSDEILLAYLATNPPNGHLMQVLSANSPLSQAVVDAIDAMNLPNGIANQIANLQNGISDLTSLENNIVSLTVNREYWIDEAIRYYLNDTLAENPIDSVIAILQNEDRIIRKEQLCDALIIKGDLANATIVKNDIIVKRGGETNFTRVAEINIDKRFADNPLEEINSDSTMTANLHDIAIDSSEARICPRGQALLYEFVYNDAIYHLVEPYMVNGNPKSQETADNLATDEVEKIVAIYPNPASTEVTIELVGYDDFIDGQINIYNLIGQKLIVGKINVSQVNTINIANLPSGIYIIRLSNVNSDFYTEKLVVR